MQTLTVDYISQARETESESKLTKNLKKYGPAILTAVIIAAVMLTFNAIAGQDDTGFDPLWEMVQTWAVGSPAKLIAVISLMSAFFFSILKPNFMMAIGSLMFCGIMGQAEAIIEAFGLTATIL